MYILSFVTIEFCYNWMSIYLLQPVISISITPPQVDKLFWDKFVTYLEVEENVDGLMAW